MKPPAGEYNNGIMIFLNTNLLITSEALVRRRFQLNIIVYKIYKTMYQYYNYCLVIMGLLGRSFAFWFLAPKTEKYKYMNNYK